MRPKILTVDDSRAVRIIVKKALSAYDCEVLEAGDGEEGLELALKETPHLILLDITMPIMDGCEMLARLKSDPLLRSIPVIMLTAEAGREMVVKITKMGVRDYIVKPFEEAFLSEKVARVVHLKPRSSFEMTELQAAYAAENLSHTIHRSWGARCDIVVIEDQPMVVEKIKNGLIGFNWHVRAAANRVEALTAVQEKVPDAILISLSLPEQSTWEIHSALKADGDLSEVPFFGIALKTATAEQQQASREGFSGVFSKPLDLAEIEHVLGRAMKLDMAGRYFTTCQENLIVKMPPAPTTGDLNEISEHARSKIASAVNSGLSSMVFDLTALNQVSTEIIQTLVGATQVAKELGLPWRVAAAAAVEKACRDYEAAKEWVYAPTLN